MAYISTGDFSGNEQKIQAEANGDGTKSPRYGFSDSALAAIAAIVTALAGKSTAENQLDILDALEALASADEHEVVTPSDSTVLSNVRALYVGVGGTVIATVNGVDATYTVPAGGTLLIRATKVKAASTATGIVAWK